VAVARFYAGSGQLPPMIVVGVRNGARTRDLTPPAAAGWSPPAEMGATGGAGQMLEFLSAELVPWVDQKYRTAPLRVLIGHSLGGLFALEVIASRPASFTGYVVMEPSTWWNAGREAASAAAALRRPDARTLRVMLVNADMRGVDTSGTGSDAPMVRTFRVQGETHTSMTLAGMMLALRRMFADFLPPRWTPGTRPIAMLAHYDSLSRRAGYTVPIPAPVFEEVFRMSVHARDFDGAAEVLARMQRELPSSDVSDLTQLLAAERASSPDPGLVPLVIARTRPTSATAARFLGRWTLAGQGNGHELDIRASGDTIIVHERVQLPDGEWNDDDAQVIGMTAGGDLEWGQRVFRGIAALLVLRGRIQEDGTMTVTRQVRGWIPRGPTGDMLRTEQLHRVSP
jgi:pimeloyl-ACP methyl ester carboxylesterase